MADKRWSWGWLLGLFAEFMILPHCCSHGFEGLITRLSEWWCYSGKEPAWQCKRHKSLGFSPWVGKIPWRRKWQPTPMFLPGKSHGQRSLADYSSWGHRELDMTEWLLLLLLSHVRRVQLCVPHRRQPTRLPRPWDSPGKNTGVGCHFLLQCMKVKSESEVAQLCLTLLDPMDCNLPGSSVHGISQARARLNDGPKVQTSSLWPLSNSAWSFQTITRFQCNICPPSLMVLKLPPKQVKISKDFCDSSPGRASP